MLHSSFYFSLNTVLSKTSGSGMNVLREGTGQIHLFLGWGCGLLATRASSYSPQIPYLIQCRIEFKVIQN